MAAPLTEFAPGPILISAGAIRRRTARLAREISARYRRRDLVLLGILNGSLFFLADLARHLSVPFRLECWRLRSYVGKTTRSSGAVHGIGTAPGDFRGADVLLVDDILDTGITLAAARARLLALGARSVRICVLVRKRRRRARPARAHWVGFDIGDEFVVGFGLDYDGRFRGLPDIRALRPAIPRTRRRASKTDPGLKPTKTRKSRTSR
ncbi:MAG: hypoxanthine phosphoribosyltransferase [Verrucomicrobiae bacterium]|nr:hypoxanthine phosphoribosyltransferase [Verrucomicrobiae bacterium]